jgi:hypothetical protein
MKTRKYKSSLKDSEIQAMLDFYTGSNDFILSIKEQSYVKGFKGLSVKQKFFVGLALLKAKNDISEHYKEFAKSFVGAK